MNGSTVAQHNRPACIALSRSVVQRSPYQNPTKNPDAETRGGPE